MIDEFREQLETEYQYGIDAQVEDDATAAEARQAGDMSTYFDMSMHLQLADVCWALEKWDEAKRWYRHNSRTLWERRAWRAKQPGQDTLGLSDSEATTFVKAGDLERGRAHLQRAVAHWRGQRAPELVLTHLGLHAAQAQLPDLATHVQSVIAARQQLPGGTSPGARQARALLHYEPAEVMLLLGRWDDFEREIARLDEAERRVKESGEPIFPEPHQKALLAASRGLRLLGALQRKEAQADAAGAAKDAFEEAMFQFHRFSGQIDWDLYFMRLNARLVDDVAAGRTPNPNPFAADV